MLSTAQKVALAGTLARTLRFVGMSQHQRVQRRGITFDLDLAEGIDLSLLIFGTFQRHVVRTVKQVVPPDGIVIDVGANIGAVALPIVAHVTSGHVYAIEPTKYAFEKLGTNIALNPHLGRRVTPVNVFISDSTKPTSDLVAYSSWPVSPGASSHHPIHKGVAMETSCAQITLDDFLAQAKLTRVDLIKIDTDGHEFDVLTGAKRCLTELRPVVVFEACEYLMQAPRHTFEDFEELFRDRGYTVCGPFSFDSLTADRFRHLCPRGGGLDLIALPDESPHRRTA